MLKRVLTTASVVVVCLNAGLYAGVAQAYSQNTGIHLSNGLRIISITPSSRAKPDAIRIAGASAGGAQPPVEGFSPLIAITTSDRRSSDDFDMEHALVSSYVGRPLNTPAEENFVIGVLDTGSVVDLAAGESDEILGLTGRYLTTTSFPIGGASGQMDTTITQPIGIFAAGLGAIQADGTLDLSQVVGHTNVAALASPAIACDNGEEVSAVVGTPMLAFYTTVIHVDQPRKVVVRGKTYIGPDIEILDTYIPSTKDYPRSIPIELGGLSPVSTASYYSFPDMGGDWEDILGDWEPIIPTLLSMMAMSLPTGGAFFTELQVVNGEPGPLNPLQTMRVLVDTGAQSSIMSSNVAARLNLPMEPDFTVQICGVGGGADAPGYYVDYVRINALGGALEFARVPFVVIDMESPEGGPLDGVLGMNFFWNRNVVLEPTVGGAGFLHVSDPVPYAFIDLNLDDVVDVADFAIFAAAWHATPTDPTWNARCDFYTDEVIDARDLQAFMDAWMNRLGR